MAIFVIVGGAWMVLMMLWVLVTQPLFSPIEEAGPSIPTRPTVDPLRLESHVRTLSQQFFPRDAFHPEGLDRAAAYIQQEFEGANGRVSKQPYDVNGIAYRNVMVLFGPETRERIIVGAHYDTAGIQPGADDNASGIAGLIELAYLLGREDPPIQVELVAYTLEEPPYFRSKKMGSAIHSASLKRARVQVRVMIALEMIGYFRDEANSQNFPFPFLRAFYPHRGNFIVAAGTLSEGMLVRRVKQAMRCATSLPVYSINAPRWVPGIDFSDHMNYWEAGYHAIMITDTAFYRNKYYHTPEDTADKLDYRRMARVVEGVHAAIRALAR